MPNNEAMPATRVLRLVGDAFVPGPSSRIAEFFAQAATRFIPPDICGDIDYFAGPSRTGHYRADAEWFLSNPSRQFRVRDLLPGEGGADDRAGWEYCQMMPPAVVVLSRVVIDEYLCGQYRRYFYAAPCEFGSRDDDAVRLFLDCRAVRLCTEWEASR